MDLNRISIKYFVEDPNVLDLEKFIPIFHGWISQAKIPGTLIDVADYRHMFQGPGVMLIGHEVDYSLDMGGGRPGLLYVRKREMPDQLKDNLAIAFKDALTACGAVEQEPSLGGAIRFSSERVMITLLDRLRAPNTAESFDLVKQDIESLTRSLYGDCDVAIERISLDERSPLAVSINAPSAPDIETLLERINAHTAQASG